MSESKNKLKGCRASGVVIQDYMNTLAEFGGAKYRIFELENECSRLGGRLVELQAELAAARAQEPKPVPAPGINPEAPVDLSAFEVAE